MTKRNLFLHLVVAVALLALISGCVSGGTIASRRLPDLSYEGEKKTILDENGNQKIIENGYEKVKVYDHQGKEANEKEIDVWRTDVFNDFILAESEVANDPSNPGKLGNFLSKGVLASDAACNDLMEKQFEFYVGINSEQSKFNIFANLAQSVMGFTGTPSKTMGLTALGIGGFNAVEENRKAFGLYSDSFKIFFDKITEARRQAAEKLKNNERSITHLDEARGILGEYHQTCSSMSLAILFEKSLEKAQIGPVENGKLDPVAQVKLTALSVEIYGLLENDIGGAFSNENLINLYFLVFGADTDYTKITLLQNNPYMIDLASKLKNLKNINEDGYKALVSCLNEVGALLGLEKKVTQARKDTADAETAKKEEERVVILTADNDEKNAKKELSIAKENSARAQQKALTISGDNSVRLQVQ